MSARGSCSRPRLRDAMRSRNTRSVWECRCCSRSRPFYVTGTRLIWSPAIPAALVVLAIAQIGVHLVFFLHITTAPDNTNNVLALAFGVLIVALVIGGSLWIMDHLNENMMPMHQMMQMQR